MSKAHIDLKFPVSSDGKEVTALDMRRPKVRDMLIADKATGADSEKEVVMFANLCEVDREVIENMDVMDYAALQGAYRDFLS